MGAWGPGMQANDIARPTIMMFNIEDMPTPTSEAEVVIQYVLDCVNDVIMKDELILVDRASSFTKYDRIQQVSVWYSYKYPGGCYNCAFSVDVDEAGATVALGTHRDPPKWTALRREFRIASPPDEMKIFIRECLDLTKVYQGR